MSDAEVSELASNLADATCVALRNCLGEQALGSFVGREPCEQRFSASLAQSDFGSLSESVARGRVKLQRDVLSQCYDDTRALGCAIQVDGLPDSCQSAIQGQVAAGATCSTTNDCVVGNFCSSGECPRTCTARLSSGSACAANEQCSDGLICIAKKCGTPAAIGDACAGTSGGVCALGTSCFGSTKTTAGTCKANAEIQVGAEGAECTPNGTLCTEGLSCAYDEASSTGFICRPAASAGGTCRQALPSQCPRDQYCSAADLSSDGTCQALPTEGQACVLSGDCAAGHVCLADAGGNPVCHKLHDLGDTCGQDADCRSARCADGTCATIAVCD